MRFLVSAFAIFGFTVLWCFAVAHVAHAQQSGPHLIDMNSVTMPTQEFEVLPSRRLNIKPGYGVDFRDPDRPVFTTGPVVTGEVVKKEEPGALTASYKEANTAKEEMRLFNTYFNLDVAGIVKAGVEVDEAAQRVATSTIRYVFVEEFVGGESLQGKPEWEEGFPVGEEIEDEQIRSQTFLQRCGSHHVTRVTHGVRFVARVAMNSRTQEDVRRLQAFLNVEVPFVAANARWSETAREYIRTLNLDIELAIIAGRIDGGRIILVGADGLETAIKLYKDNKITPGPVKFEANTNLGITDRNTYPKLTKFLSGSVAFVNNAELQAALKDLVSKELKNVKPVIGFRDHIVPLGKMKHGGDNNPEFLGPFAVPPDTIWAYIGNVNALGAAPFPMESCEFQILDGGKKVCRIYGRVGQANVEIFAHCIVPVKAD